MEAINYKSKIKTINIGDYTIETYDINYIKRIKGLYGFIYVTTNLINGKKYIGQKKIDKRKRWISYLGSGVAFKEALKKYGKENFHREIIDIAFTKGELNYWERYYTILFDSVSDENWYNMCYGGGTYILTEEQRKALSERMKGEGNPMYGRKHTKEELERLSERFSGENNPMYGKFGKEAPGHRSNRIDLIKMNQYTIDNDFIKTFSSITDAAESINRSATNIRACATGKTRHCGGYKWYYADDQNQPDKSKIIVNKNKTSNISKNNNQQMYKFIDRKTKNIICGIVIDYENKEYTYYPNGSKKLSNGDITTKKKINELLEEMKLLQFSGTECKEKINLSFSTGYYISVYGKGINVFVVLEEKNLIPTIDECNIIKNTIEKTIEEYYENTSNDSLSTAINKAIMNHRLECTSFGYQIILKKYQL